MSTRSAQEGLGELLCEYTLRLGSPTEYGASLDAVVSGQEAPPPAGLRVDLPFEGEASGRVAGTRPQAVQVMVVGAFHVDNPGGTWPTPISRTC